MTNRIGFLPATALVLMIVSLVARMDAEAQTPTPSATVVPTRTTVTVTAAVRSLRCNEQTQVDVSVQGPGAPTQATFVSLSSDLGSIPAMALTTPNSVASTRYTAPSAGSGIATITASVGGFQGQTTVQVSCPSVPASLGFPAVTCLTSQANVRFTWTPVAGALSQWVDVSTIDNGFLPGTFTGRDAGPRVDELTWAGLHLGVAYLWRINAQTADGWTTTATSAFVPCGAAAVRGTTSDCGNGAADLTFYIAPPSPTALSTWLDVSLQDDVFAPGTFQGRSMNATQQTLQWPGLLPGTIYYWRVNNLLGSGWRTSETASFRIVC